MLMAEGVTGDALKDLNVELRFLEDGVGSIRNWDIAQHKHWLREVGEQEDSPQKRRRRLRRERQRWVVVKEKSRKKSRKKSYKKKKLREEEEDVNVYIYYILRSRLSAE